MSLTKPANTLIAHEMPLQGIHLIEASAGTGKTYNITRIYIRLLLEKKLTVQQILVMTFTKDATEEIRGRIDDFIRLALSQWHELKVNDAFFESISSKIIDEEAHFLLKQALLFLDEAAIFTIHGFCKNILTQYAFESGVSFNANMDSEPQSIVKQAVQDWYRFIASDNPQAFLQVIEFWPVPESFISHFSKAIAKNTQLSVDDSDLLISSFKQQAQLALTQLSHHQAFLFEQLVDGKAKAEQEKRQYEYHQLMTWLEAVIVDHLTIELPIPASFFDARRYSRSKVKAELVTIFAEVVQVKTQAKTLLKDIAKLAALAIVKDGIDHIREKIQIEKSVKNILSFDDLITVLATRLNETSGEVLTKALFTQYPAALVDEFQDTDPDQFSILKSIYYHQKNLGTLMMIGDPKQAIYGFRGGDVFAYMNARNDCEHQWVMDTNWRSTPEIINGYNRLFYGNSLKSEAKDVFGYQIPYFPVKASPLALKKSVVKPKNSASLRFIHFEPEREKSSVAQSFRQEMAMWCANEIISLLNDDAATIQAKDIALLVRDGTEAKEIKLALFNAGIPSVYLSNRVNLLHSEQTTQLIQLLKGILFVENERLFSASLTSPLLSITPNDFSQLQLDELAWQEMKFSFHALRNEWLNKGFITMALKLLHGYMAIAGDDSERCLTNVLHLFEILQMASQKYRQPQELLFWFEQQSLAEFPDLETELRLESEENLIRIITQHGSKGLEYPVVFIPFATRYKNPLKIGNRQIQLIEYHNAAGDFVLSLSGSDEAKKQMSEEAFAETIRLLYVSVTRAEQRCYILCTAFDNFHLSPLGLTCQWQKDSNIKVNLQRLVDDEPQDISAIFINKPVNPKYYQATQKENEKTHVSKFTGHIERDWWLSSFTALSRNVRDNGVSTPDRDGEKVQINKVIAAHDNHHLLRFALTKGAKTGNLLHDIFEHLNFVEPEWAKAFKWPLVKFGELGRGFEEADLQTWLIQVLDTVLSGEANNYLTLSKVSFEKSLRETEFYFPLNNANTKKLSTVLFNHRQSSAYNIEERSPNRHFLSISIHKYLKGMMHGFIDLIFEHQDKFYICDYKSNHLGDSFDDYQVEQLQKDIEKHHYDLQYLIYSLALHRYLKTTVQDYQVEYHFGGVYYLYLRGMTNVAEYQGRGVYHRQITAQELEALDSIFSGENSPLGDQVGSMING